MDQWYLIFTKPRQELRAKQHLENQNFRLFFPQLLSFRIKGGRQVKSLNPLFPRYIFIKLDKQQSAWHSIRSTRGIVDLVRFSDQPVEVPDTVIQSLKVLANQEGIVDQTLTRPFIYNPGDCVEITEGSFKGIQAIVKEQNEEERVCLLINMLGKQHSVNLPISSVSTFKD